MKRIICILFCVILLCTWTSAAEESELKQELDQFIQKNSLDESNFALSYFNTVSGESYAYNTSRMFPVGEVWTLPLHMYYTLQEHNGAFLPEEGSPEAVNPDYEYTINGMSLDTCRIESIINGNLSVSETMRDAVMQYKNVINEEYGHLSDGELNESFYNENCYSAKFLMNCMLELSRESEIYGELMRLYDMVPQPEGYFSSEDSAASRYRTVQVRGEEDGFVCAVAEVSAASPYLIVCMVSKDAGGDELLAKVNDLIASYVESQSPPTDESAATQETEKNNAMFHVNSTVSDKTPAVRIILIALGCAFGVAALIYLIYRFAIRNRKY